MLSWLDNFWHSAAGYAGQQVANAVHWAMHGITGVILSVFGLVRGAWSRLAGAARGAWSTVTDLAQAVWQKFAYLLRVVIPGVLRWAGAQLARLSAFALSVWKALLRDVASLTARIIAAAASITRWVIRTVWAPLAARAEQIWRDLLKWGYLAWWYITHPDKLAALLLMFLVVQLEAQAWQVARLLGTFTLALIRANLRRIALLAEEIITAVF